MEPVAAEVTDALTVGIEQLHKARATLKDEIVHIVERRKNLHDMLKELDEVHARLESDQKGLTKAIKFASELSVARSSKTPGATSNRKRKRKATEIAVKVPRRSRESNSDQETQDGAASESDSDVFERRDRRTQALQVAEKIEQASKTAEERDKVQMHKGDDHTWGT